MGAPSEWDGRGERVGRKKEKPRPHKESEGGHLTWGKGPNGERRGGGEGSGKKYGQFYGPIS